MVAASYVLYISRNTWLQLFSCFLCTGAGGSLILSSGSGKCEGAVSVVSLAPLSVEYSDSWSNGISLSRSEY